jgi:hypothetical protein
MTVHRAQGLSVDRAALDISAIGQSILFGAALVL